MPEYIDRESIIAHMKDLPTWWADAGGTYGKPMKYPDGMFDCDDVINSLESAPAADVAPVRHGHIVTTTDRGAVMHQSCSECREELGWKEYPNYCPNCGARLDLDDDRNAQG